MKKLVYVLCAAVLSVSLFTGCYSVPDHIPGDLTSQQLIQLGQSSFEEGNIKAAELYYLTLIERYGSDTAIRVEALYEIAHFAVKQKDWDKAVPLFDEIFAIYEADGMGILPGAYRRLAEGDLKKIPPEKLVQAREKAAQESGAEDISASGTVFGDAAADGLSAEENVSDPLFDNEPAPAEEETPAEPEAPAGPAPIPEN